MATRAVRPRRLQLEHARPASNVCLELEDHGTHRQSALTLFGLRRERGSDATAARLADQFVRRNRSVAELLKVRLAHTYDGADVQLSLESSGTVGAVPLISPSSGQPDFGLVVQPRFPWPGIGPMLAEMGWRVVPAPLKLPLLHRSERRVPPWVLSSMVLIRLRTLLDSLERRFENVSEDRTAPRGRVDWTSYATKRVPFANLLSIPCSFPDLRDDRLVKGAIRHTLERQISSLNSQRHNGTFVLRLIELADTLHRRVSSVPAFVPGASMLRSWMNRPLTSNRLVEGLQAIEWTMEDRGLAGVSDLEGLPWTMPMDQFFEAWIETILSHVAARTGAQTKIGRKKETVHPLSWNPPYLGSQKSLIPDIYLEWPGLTFIVDAKYKRHWEELQHHSWSALAAEMREAHRADLLQVLAYANLARTASVIACLAFPCSLASWESLLTRRRLFHKAVVTSGPRSIQLWLTAVPMAAPTERVAAVLADELRPHLSFDYTKI